MKTRIKIISMITLLFSATLSTTASSTGHILGKLTLKESGKPIAFSVIVFENSMDRVEVLTNEHGFYYASYMPAGRYRMSIFFNDRTFTLERVRVMDSYSNVLDLALSNETSLPHMVEIEPKPWSFSSVSATDIVLANSTFNQPTRTLEEALSMQPGLDVINGKLYVKGSDDVRFFIDGTPVLGQPRLGRGW